MNTYDSTSSSAAVPVSRYIAFEGHRQLAFGDLREVAEAAKEASDRADHAAILVFDHPQSRPVELDLRGSLADVLQRLESGESANRDAKTDAPAHPESTAAESPNRRRRGRPKLGVVGKEVTLLPRHWQWLSRQPGGASVTLRKLVDKARKDGAAADRRRLGQESAYRFMTAMAGNQPGFEEAIRALFAGRSESFSRHLEAWPEDLRRHAHRLAKVAFDAEETAT